MTILNNDEYDDFCRVIHNPNISNQQAAMLVALHRRAGAVEKNYEAIDEKRRFIASDRDNRTRRMQIASVILDEAQVVDLDKIAEIIWPNPNADEFEEVPPKGFVSERQIPDGMRHCTILFKECEKGHGWLTATNWVQHSCQQCVIDDLKRQLDGAGVVWSHTLDDQPVYRQGAQVQTLPFAMRCPQGHLQGDGDCSSTCFVDEKFTDTSQPTQLSPSELQQGLQAAGVKLPQSGDTYVSWDCITMGHHWGPEFYDINHFRTHKCMACNDTRLVEPSAFTVVSADRTD